MRSTLLAANLGSTWRLLEDSGYQADTYFQKAGIDPDIFNKAGSRIDIGRALDLLQRVYTLFNDPCLGLKYSKYWHPSNLYALGYTWVSSKTLNAGLHRIVRYSKILNEAVIFSLEEAEKVITLNVDYTFESTPDIDRLFPAITLSVFVAMCRANYGEDLNPERVTFKHGSPPCSGEYFAYFKTNVQFAAKRNSITFPRDAMEKALLSHDPQMVKYADQVATTYLSKMDKKNLSHRVKVTIIERLPSGDASLNKIAKQLYMSDRNLSRKLKRAGTSFRELLNETRKDMAIKYLEGENVDYRELPYLLGYKDYPTFFRAYKRWTGESPSGRTR